MSLILNVAASCAVFSSRTLTIDAIISLMNNSVETNAMKQQTYLNMKINIICFH